MNPLDRTPVPTAVYDERNMTPDTRMRAYRTVHAIGNTQLGGVRGDCLSDLYQSLESICCCCCEFIIFYSCVLTGIKYNSTYSILILYKYIPDINRWLIVDTCYCYCYLVCI